MWLKKSKKLAVWVGMWTLIGSVLAAMVYVPTIGTTIKFPVPWWEHLGWVLVQYYIWGALSLIIVRLVRRFPVERERWIRSVFIYLSTCVLFAGAWAVIFISIYELAGASYVKPSGGATPPLSNIYWSTFVTRFPTQSLPVFLTIAIIIHASAYYRRFKHEQLRAAELKADLNAAQLQSLKMQLHPHFLFNTLIAIILLFRRFAERYRHADRHPAALRALHLESLFRAVQML